MLVHSVYFWLKPDLSEDARAAFRLGLESLAGIDGAAAVYIGTPAATAERPVVERSYDYGLTVVVPDVAGHDAYQADPIHQAFVERFKPYWTRIMVTDFD